MDIKSIRSLDEMRLMSNEVLRVLARTYLNNVEFKRINVMLELLKICVQTNEISCSGTLEVSQDGFGFLRTSDNSYLPARSDIYVSNKLIKSLYLKTGDIVEGLINHASCYNGYYPAIYKIVSINYSTDLHNRSEIIRFNDLIPEFPTRRIRLDNPGTDTKHLIGRAISIFAPIGFGQRAIIVAPPRTGKTFVIKSIAQHIEENHPEAVLIIFLVDERPEEVTEMKKIVKSEVISSTFDELPSRHVKIADMVLNKAKRLVENGKDVIILLDAITRLARAYNAVAPSSGRALSGGIESNALHKPKKFFGAARNIANGGSLTIIGTALVETGSKMDEVIFEEFKGTGNCEIHLDRKIAERRIFPAIDIHKSGTRMDHLLFQTYNESRASKIAMLRHIMSSMNAVEALEFMISNMQNTNDNEQFFLHMNKPVR